MVSPNPEIRNQDMLALRAFVTAQDHRQASNTSILSLDITHSNLQQRHLESRFPVDATLYDLRLRLYQTTGTPPRDQLLQLYDHIQATNPVVEIPPDLYIDTDDQLPLLSFFHVGVCGKVHCVDINPHSTSARGALENVNLVQKFQLSEEAYNQRENTLRAWCRQQKSQNPNFTLEQYALEQRQLAQAKMCLKRGQPLPQGFQLDQESGEVIRIPGTSIADQIAIQYNEASVQHAHINNRCQVSPGGRRGVVRWIGQVQNKPGYWIGVELDEPVGQNNGTLDDISYFDTGPQRGCFVRGPNVQVGDFPERDLLDDDDSDGEM